MSAPDSAPSLSVVVPTRGRALLLRTLEALEAQGARDRLEILVVGRARSAEVARGIADFARRVPGARHLPLEFAAGDSSRKKNAGWRAARAPIVAFLDDDTVPPPDWAERILAPFSDAAVRVVSGPGRVPDDAPRFARWAGLALSSRAAGYVAERYRAADAAPRPAPWSRLIGCNMAWRKEALEEIGGFDSSFWPGEEMLAAWRAVGRDANRMRFHPGAGVDHMPRATLAGYWRQVAGYGATRIRLMRAGVAIEWPTLLPAAGLPLMGALLLGAWRWRAAAALLAGLCALYGLFVMGAALEMARATRRRGDLGVAVLIPLMHLAYGFGSWREIFRPNRDFSGDA